MKAKKSESSLSVVRVEMDRKLVQQARFVASHTEKSLNEYLNLLLGPLIARDFAWLILDLASKDDKSKDPGGNHV